MTPEPTATSAEPSERPDDDQSEQSEAGSEAEPPSDQLPVDPGSQQEQQQQ